jgi:hypothetical protein
VPRRQSWALATVADNASIVVAVAANATALVLIMGWFPKSVKDVQNARRRIIFKQYL